MYFVSFKNINMNMNVQAISLSYFYFLLLLLIYHYHYYCYYCLMTVLLPLRLSCYEERAVLQQLCHLKTPFHPPANVIGGDCL